MLTSPKFDDGQIGKDLKESMGIKGGKKRKSKKRRNLIRRTIKRRTIKRKITKKNIKKSKNYSKRQKYIPNGGAILRSGLFTDEENKKKSLVACGVTIPTKDTIKNKDGSLLTEKDGTTPLNEDAKKEIVAQRINEEYLKYAALTPFVDATSPDVNCTKLYINILDGNREKGLIPTPESYMDLDFWFGHIGISIDDSMFDKYPQYLEYKDKVFGFGPDLRIDPIEYLKNKNTTPAKGTNLYNNSSGEWEVTSETSDAFEDLSYKMSPFKRHTKEEIEKLYFGNLSDDTDAFMYKTIEEKPFVLQSRNKVEGTNLLKQRTCIRIPVLTELSLQDIIENYIKKYINNVKIEQDKSATVNHPDIRYGVISNQPCYGENNVNATTKIDGEGEKISVYNCITFPCDKLQLFTYKKYLLNKKCTFIKESLLSVGIGRCGQVWTIDTYFKSPTTEIYSNKEIEQWNFFSRKWEPYNEKIIKNVPTGTILIKYILNPNGSIPFYIKSEKTSEIFDENGTKLVDPTKKIQNLFLPRPASASPDTASDTASDIDSDIDSDTASDTP
jgi:hypothetical protein